MRAAPPTKPKDKPAQPSATKMARTIVVAGKVQGVFFREWTVGKAREIGISGWVRNLRDGRVEVYAIAEAALLDRFTDHLRRGSPASQVEQIQIENAEVEKIDGFSRRQTL